MAGKKISYEVDVDASDAISDFQKVGKEAERAGKAIKKGLDVQPDTGKVDKFISNLKQAADEAENVAKAVQGIKKFAPEVDDSELAGMVLALRKAGVEFDAIEAKAKELGDALKQVGDSPNLKNLDSGMRTASGGADQLTRSVGGSRSVLANMVGNATQDLGALGGVAGSAGVAIGQMGEYMADARLEGEGMRSVIKNFAGIAGPIALISIGIGLVTKAFGAFQAKQKELAENTRETAEAIAEITGAAEELDAVLADVGETGEDFGDILLSALGPEKLGDALTAAHKLGIEITDLGDMIAGLGEKGSTGGFDKMVASIQENTGLLREDAIDVAEAATVAGDNWAIFYDLLLRNTDLSVEQIESLRTIFQLYGDIGEVADNTDINKAAQKQLDLLDDTVEGLERVNDARDRLADRGIIDPSAIQVATEVYAATEQIVRSVEDLNAALAGQETLTQSAAQNWRIITADMADGAINTQAAADAVNIMQQYLGLENDEMDELVAQKTDEYMLDVAAAEEEAAAEALRLSQAVADLKDTFATIDADDFENISSGLESELNKVDDIFAGLKFDVDFQPALNEALDGLSSFGPDLQTLADEWANILAGKPIDIFGNVRADDAEFQAKMADLTNLFQEGVVNAFDQGGVEAANTFVQSTAAQIAASTGLSIAEVYRIMGLPPDGSVDMLLKPIVDAEAKADALAIIDSLIGVDPNNPAIAYLRLAVQSDAVPAQVAEVAARILASKATGLPIDLEGVTQADIDAALALIAQYEVVIPTAADQTGARDDIAEVEGDDYETTINADADTTEAAGQLLDEETRQRQATIYAIAAITSAKIALDSLKAQRTAPVTAVAYTREAEQDLQHLARRRDTYVYAHTVPVGGGGGGGGGGTGPGTLLAPAGVGVAPLADSEDDVVGVTPFAAPAMSSVPSSGVAVVGMAPTSINNNYVTVNAGIVGNKNEMDRIISEALRRHVRLNGVEELMSAPAIVGVTRARPRIDLGVGDSRDAQGLGQWQPAEPGNAANTRWVTAAATTGTSTWNGEEPTWFDVTCYGIEIETYVGRDRAVDQWEVGTATIVLDNADGWADFPRVTPSPVDLTVRPGRQVRVAMVVDDGEPIVLWRGWVDQANPGYDPEYGATVTLECIDAKGEIGRAAVAAVDPPVGAGESIATRLNRIADAAVWPTYWRNFQATGINVVGTELGGQAADLLNKAADSGGGSLYGDVDAKLRYRNRDWQLWPADAPEDATIGNVFPGSFDAVELTEDPADSGLFYDAGGDLVVVEDPAGSGLYDVTSDTWTMIEDPEYSGLYVFGVWNDSDVCPVSWEQSFAREDITTRVLIGRPDMDTPIQRDDEDAQELYGVEPLDLTDVETVLDVEMTQLADRLLVTRGHATMPRVAGVTLNAATAPNVLDVLATADPRTPTRYRCRHIQDGRQVFNRFMLCTAVRHTIGPDTWEARLSLDDAMPWQIADEGAGFRWSTTEVAEAGHWQESLWSADITP